MHWDFSTIADRLGEALAAAEQELRLEQAVYGLDARDERAIQSLLAERLGGHYQVAREVHYPSTRGKKLSHRMRVRPRALAARAAAAADSSPPTLFDPPADQLCEPAEALWLEVKVAYQFREGGARHGGYGSQWRQAVVDDLRKMEADPLIHGAGLALIVFNESQDILGKDLELFEDVLARKEVLAGFRQVRTTPILERIGHTLCTVALWPTIQR